MAIPDRDHSFVPQPISKPLWPLSRTISAAFRYLPTTAASSASQRRNVML